MLAPPQGSSESPEEILQELSHDLMSPFCPGRTIAACPSSAARKLEDEILVQAKDGKSREEIEGVLVERYGQDIVGYRPPPLLLWGTIVLGVVALMLLVGLGRRWARRASAKPDAATAGGPSGRPGSGTGSEEPQGRRPPTRAELDALDDALDDEEGF